MPYHIENNCVKKSDTGETVKCHQSKAEALAHLRALEANVEDAKNMGMMKLSQAETNYGAANGTVGKACSNCRWFCDDMCHLVEGDIAPNGLCDRWEVVPQEVSTPPEPIPVTIVEPPVETEDSQEMALPTTRRGFIDLVKDVLKALTEPALEPAFSVFKINGTKYWISRHTGKWKDREDEIIANHSHDEYVTRVQSGKVPMPELWAWHKKGSRHGVADMVWKSGGFTLALGHFDNTPIAERAFKFYQKHRGKIKLSHMFNFPRNAKKGRVYHAYNTVEITTLPDGAEAFPYTSFEELDMSLSDTQRAFIKELGGDEMLSRVEAADTKALADTSKLEALGVESKGLDNFEGSDIPADKALEALKSDVDTRLKAFEALPARIDALQTIITTMSKEVKEAQGREASALKELNDLKLKLLEYQTLAPPSSRSNDTILNEREKSLIQTVAQKEVVSTSLINMVTGSQPAVTEQ